MENLTWEIKTIFGSRYKTLNPQNMEELGYGINHNILNPNKNTLIPPEPEYNEELENMWNAF